MANINLPSINIEFKGKGVSAIQRGTRGYAVLVLKDDTDTSFTFATYSSMADLNATEVAKYTSENVEYIKDVLKGIPKEVMVARLGTSEQLSDTLVKVKGKARRNCWIALGGCDNTDQNTLVTFVKEAVANDNKKYKAMVYKATSTDDQHIVNFANDTVTMADSRGEVSGDKFIPRLMGYFAGLPLTMSGIAKTFDDVVEVVEVDDSEQAVNDGKLVVINDEGKVRIARAVNSLVTISDDMSDDFKYILITEVMDLIYTDIHDVFKNSYMGKYKNKADNQALFVGAINGYFTSLANDNILDSNYSNRAFIDIEAQRLALIPKYGNEVKSWSNDRVRETPYGTHVYLSADILISNAIEDMNFVITL